jgi:hypothetical protein
MPGERVHVLLDSGVVQVWIGIRRNPGTKLHFDLSTGGLSRIEYNMPLVSVTPRRKTRMAIPPPSLRLGAVHFRSSVHGCSC